MELTKNSMWAKIQYIKEKYINMISITSANLAKTREIIIEAEN